MIYTLVKTLKRGQKQSILLMVDLVLVPLTLCLAFALQFNVLWPIPRLAAIWWLSPFLMFAAVMISLALGIPRIQLKAYEARAIGKTGVFALGLALVGVALNELAHLHVSVAVFISFAVITFLAGVASRMAMLHILLWIYRRGQPRCRVLIYGAGSTGLQLAAALKSHETIKPVAFVDDNPALQGMTVAGLPVHAPVKIDALISTRHIRRVLLAMPSSPQQKQMQVARRLERLGLDVHALPSFAQLVGEEELIAKLTPINPADLLGRARLDLGLPGVADTYAGRVVMISGAGGSIGSELCRQLIQARPSKLVLYEHSELALYSVDKDLRGLSEETGIEIVPVLGSVTDARRARQTLSSHRVDVVLHAAAYKHVPLVEINPVAGLANNVLGTKCLAEAARAARVGRFILISTDKAVRPKSVMGASKRLAELVVQDLATRNSTTLFSMVRFGNVLGSSGSVIPLFQEQISRGGPVTLTHAEVSRYFMTIPEAARLVLLAGAFARGGDTFVLDMGAPVPIRRLARQMIEAAGYSVRDAQTPGGDIEIITTGLRPGEKLHEELLTGSDMLTTPHPKILRVRETNLSEIEVANALHGLNSAIDTDDAEAACAVIDRWVGDDRKSAPQKTAL